MTKSSIRAFTLVELLIVIAIIAILTGIMTANFSASKAKARDAKRISDLSNLQLALELYFDRCRLYPPNIDPDASTTCNSGEVKLSQFIKVPTPPAGAGQTEYGYKTNSFKTDYVINAILEKPNVEIVRDGRSDLDGISNPPVCDDSKNDDSLNYCLGPK